MKRADFIKIITLRSVWKIDKRKGNYRLPNGEKLSSYIEEIVRSQMQLDQLGINAQGDLCFMKEQDEEVVFGDYILLIPFSSEEEICSYELQEQRIKSLAIEICC